MAPNLSSIPGLWSGPGLGLCQILVETSMPTSICIAVQNKIKAFLQLYYMFTYVQHHQKKNKLN
jgi:hypothetical protein